MDKENTKSKKNKDEITSNIASYICWGILIAFMIWATIKLKQIENTRQIVEICNGNPVNNATAQYLKGLILP